MIGFLFANIPNFCSYQRDTTFMSFDICGATQSLGQDIIQWDQSIFYICIHFRRCLYRCIVLQDSSAVCWTHKLARYNKSFFDATSLPIVICLWRAAYYQQWRNISRESWRNNSVMTPYLYSEPFLYNTIWWTEKVLHENLQQIKGLNYCVSQIWGLASHFYVISSLEKLPMR